MKAILVLDEMPKSCTDCPLINEEWSKCMVEWRNEDDEKRPSWCPLRPLPYKKSYVDYFIDRSNGNENRSYWAGWNACIKEIEEMEGYDNA